MLNFLFRWTLRIVVVVWLVLLIVLGAKFAMNNTQSISVDLVLWQLPEASTGFVLCVTLLAGVLLGVGTVIPALIIFKAKMRSLKAKLVKVEKSLAASQPRHLIDPSLK